MQAFIKAGKVKVLPHSGDALRELHAQAEIARVAAWERKTGLKKLTDEERKRKRALYFLRAKEKKERGL